MIYFIQAINVDHRRSHDDGPIKIGYCNHDLRSRFTTMQIDNASELMVLGVIPDGTYEQESALHEEFVSDCIRGEWFRPSKRLVSFIRYSSWGYKLGRTSDKGERHYPSNRKSRIEYKSDPWKVFREWKHKRKER